MVEQVYLYGQAYTGTGQTSMIKVKQFQKEFFFFLGTFYIEGAWLHDSVCLCHNGIRLS
jgi:hypothetical protein